MKFIFWIAFFVFLIALGPVLTIWSLNTLFPMLAIPYSMETWAAVVILGGIISAKVNGK